MFAKRFSFWFFVLGGTFFTIGSVELMTGKFVSYEHQIVGLTAMFMATAIWVMVLLEALDDFTNILVAPATRRMSHRVWQVLCATLSSVSIVYYEFSAEPPSVTLSRSGLVLAFVWFGFLLFGLVVQWFEDYTSINTKRPSDPPNVI